MSTPLLEQVRAALGTVNDPEIKRPITDLGMVDTVEVDGRRRGPRHGAADRVRLSAEGHDHPRRQRRRPRGPRRHRRRRSTLGVMTPEQRAGLKDTLSGGKAQRDIAFAQPGSLTKVFAIASGKGGVGKSSVTVNLALAMAGQGLRVGVVDADIYGHSVPGHARAWPTPSPTQVEDLIMPVPTASGVSVISIGMLKPRRDQVVAWRGPMLDRALVQMLADVYWGDLDVLLLDLPPGTGDVAISLGQHLPGAEVVVVTTPQEAAAEVAERAGTMASMMHQRVVGVVENMSYLPCPHCTPAGTTTASRSSAPAAATGSPRRSRRRFGYDVPVLGQIPLDTALREGGDIGKPIVESDADLAGGRRAHVASPPSSPAAAAGWPACSSGSRPPVGCRSRPCSESACRRSPSSCWWRCSSSAPTSSPTNASGFVTARGRWNETSRRRGRRAGRDASAASAAPPWPHG